MRLLSPQAKAYIRRQALRAMPDTCTIRRGWSGTDGGYLHGGTQTVAEGVPCRLMPETQRDATGLVADREAGTTFWKLALPAGTDVRDGDTVEHNAIAYNVVQLFAAQTDAVFVEAQLSRIEEPAVE